MIRLACLELKFVRVTTPSLRMDVSVCADVEKFDCVAIA